MTSLKTAAAAASFLVLTATGALADCKVSDHEKKNFFGGDKTYSTTFSGNSAKTIWEKYCKPYIQRNIDKHDIKNGEFGMHCTGRLSCNIQGDIVNGRVQIRRLDF